MKVVGIVAEFDPFHKGHEYLLKQARAKGATHIAVVMSGAAVQRGEISVCSKHERAENALKCGADLVAELPTPYSCSSARYFADGAVRILGQLGIDALCFGSETESADMILKAARAMDELEDSEAVKKRLSRGISYPAALHAAVYELYGYEAAKALDTPNSTLGAEYVRALERNGIGAEVLPVKRVGSKHGELYDESSGEPNLGAFDMKDTEYLSGSQLRLMLFNEADITDRVPEGCVPKTLYKPAAAHDILLYGLLTAERERLLALPEVNEPLADRIVKIRRDPPDTLRQFFLTVKSANFTYARIARSALHLTLGITREDFSPPPYVRILAFNERGAEILRRAKPTVPLSTSLRELENSSEQAAHIIDIENRAVRLQQICRVPQKPRPYAGHPFLDDAPPAPPKFENEYTRKIVIKK